MKDLFCGETIDRFDEENSFLSNFFLTDIQYGEKIYKSSEHLFQVLKATNEVDRELIRKATTPGRAKRLGRRIKCREDWDKVKDAAMVIVLTLKFTQNSELKEKLLATEEKLLIEGNNWGDKYWGQVNGVGKNKLGRILMSLRGAIRRLRK